MALLNSQAESPQCGGKGFKMVQSRHKVPKRLPKEHDKVVDSQAVCYKDIILQIEKAQKHVSDLCTGKARWTMTVPARQDDSDILISTALSQIKEIIQSL